MSVDQKPTHKLIADVPLYGTKTVVPAGTLLHVRGAQTWHAGFKAYRLDGVSMVVMLNDGRVAPLYDDGMRFRALIYASFNRGSDLTDKLEKATDALDPQNIEEVRRHVDSCITASGWKDE